MVMELAELLRPAKPSFLSPIYQQQVTATPSVQILHNLSLSIFQQITVVSGQILANFGR